MPKEKKSLKYRDLPWELRDQVDFTYGHIQKAQNPTIKHILKRLKKFKKMYAEEGLKSLLKKKKRLLIN